MGNERKGHIGQSSRLVEEAVKEGRDGLVVRSTGMLEGQKQWLLTGNFSLSLSLSKTFSTFG